MPLTLFSLPRASSLTILNNGSHDLSYNLATILIEKSPLHLLNIDVEAILFMRSLMLF